MILKLETKKIPQKSKKKKKKEKKRKKKEEREKTYNLLIKQLDFQSKLQYNKRRKKVEEKTDEKSKKGVKIHDAVSKELLEYEEELIDYMRDFLDYHLKKEDLKLINKEYRLKKSLITKYIDILCQIKGKEVFIIIEHQSTIDYKMSERISEECLAIVQSRDKYMKRSKNRKVPVILPIVLCTANKKWDAPTTLIENEDNPYKFPKQNYPRYIVVNNKDYTIDELLKKRTGIAVDMAFEKVETKEEIDYIIDKLKKFGKVNKREERALKLIIENIELVMPNLMKHLPEEEIEKTKKEMIEIMSEGGNCMSNFERAIAKIIKENNEARAEGRAEGRTEGRTEGILQVVREMLKNKMTDEDIIKCTHISEKELEELKLQMA